MVYVDPAIWPKNGKKWCHLVADSHDELVSFALIWLGLKREWIQDEGTYKEHFDLTASKRARAIKLGAKPISALDMGHLMVKKREEQKRVQTTQEPSESRPISKETISQVSKP